MKRRRFLAVAATGAAAALAGCAPSSSLSESAYDVGMVHNAFQPRAFEARVGDTVTWGNTGSRPHTVTAYDGGLPGGADYFASGGFDGEDAARSGWPREGAIDPGETYRHTFEVAGRHEYFCIPHEPAGMVGAVVVRE